MRSLAVSASEMEMHSVQRLIRDQGTSAPDTRRQARRELMSKLTLIHTGNPLDRCGEEHANGHHAEDLDSVSAHVEHEAIHGEVLGRRVGHLPRLRQLQLGRVGGCCEGLPSFCFLGVRVPVWNGQLCSSPSELSTTYFGNRALRTVTWRVQRHCL